MGQNILDQTLPLCVGFTHYIYASPSASPTFVQFNGTIYIFNNIKMTIHKITQHNPIFIELWTISSSYSRTHRKWLHHVQSLGILLPPILLYIYIRIGFLLIAPSTRDYPLCLYLKLNTGFPAYSGVLHTAHAVLRPEKFDLQI